MSKLKVNLNFKTGRMGENNCRIVSAGSELDKMYEKAYLEYTENEKQKKLEREWLLHYC